MPGITVINSGSVSLSYDGDRRAAYLLLDDVSPVICYMTRSHRFAVWNTTWTAN